MSKSLVIIGILNIMFFIALAGAVYEVRMENQELEKRMYFISDHIDKDIQFLEEFVDKNHFDFHKYLEHNEKNVNELKKRLSVVDESIDPKNKRWALIKRVRSVIEKYANPKMNITDYTYVAGAVVDFSEAHDVPISLVLAVMRRESAFNPRAKSHAGALGIMQIMPATAVDIAAEIGKRQYSLYNSKHNIQLGTYYLWKMTDRFHGDVELAVRAYNCGPICVEKVAAGDWSKYPDETIKYHEAVMFHKKEFEEIGL